jgi:prepilin-type N-terminal cleavage/methylation domain-containing protein
MKEKGFTLLEAMVALVILALVVVGYLEVFGAGARNTRNVETWTQAVTYAEEGMELAKLNLESALLRGRESLPAGFQRQITSRPTDGTILMVTVTITFPESGRFVLNRLVESP